MSYNSKFRNVRWKEFLIFRSEVAKFNILTGLTYEGDKQVAFFFEFVAVTCVLYKLAGQSGS